MGDLLFIPTGIAFLDQTLEWRREIVVPNRKRDLSTEDVKRTYALWHESVHVLQVLTSPFIFEHGRLLTSLALHALDCNNTTQLGPLALLRRQYSELRVKLSEGRPSPQEIVEINAVALGVHWLAPDNDFESLWILLEMLYPEPKSPNVLALHMASEAMGKGNAIALIPRLCFIALQTESPSATLAALVRKVMNEHCGDRLAQSSPRVFCAWAGVNPQMITRSLRERAAAMTRLDGTPLGLVHDPWLQSFGDYFDAYEAISDIDERLAVVMGAGRGGLKTSNIFHPRLLVYSDGEVTPGRGQAEPGAVEAWLQFTHDLVSGLKVLDGKQSDLLPK